MAVSTIKGNQYGVIEGTTASAVNTPVENVSYPDGFTHNNCIAVGMAVQFSNGSWFNNYAGNDFFTNNHGATVTVSASGFTNRPFRIALIKIA